MPVNDMRSCRPRALWVIFLLLASVHVAATWAQPSVFWGDIGRWLHEVERFASGEVLYRDYIWPFPPLAVWIIGGLGRWFGSDLQVVWSITSLIFLGVCSAYYRFAELLVPRGLLPLVLLSGLLLATAYADRVGAPLALGAYTPAAPLGALFLLVAMILSVQFRQRPRPSSAWMIGALCGACVLSKQDFWLPAAFLVVALWIQAPGPVRFRRLLEGSLAAGLVTLAAAAKIVFDAGAPALLGMATGFGQVEAFGGLSVPTWEGFVLELAMASLLAGAILTCLVVASAERRPFLLRGLAGAGALAALSMGVYVWANHEVAERILAEGLPAFPTGPEQRIWKRAEAGQSIAKEALKLMRDRGVLHIPAAIFPVTLLGVGWLRGPAFRRSSAGRTALVLLGLCVAARARRSLSGIDWYHFLLEIPIYVSTLPALLAIEGRQAQRALALALCGVLVGAGWSYWNFGSGPLTRAKPTVRVETARGPIHISERSAGDLVFLQHTLDAADPAGIRPLLAFGKTGSLGYFLGRSNPIGATDGYALSPWEPGALVDEILAGEEAPFLVDIRSFQRVAMPKKRIRLNRWDFELEASVYTRIDRPHFERLLAHCPALLDRRPESARPFFAVFDCAPGWGDPTRAAAADDAP